MKTQTMLASMLTVFLSAIPTHTQAANIPQTFEDDFNRANTNGAGGGLGVNWTVPATVFVNSNVAKTQTAGEQLAIYNSVTLSDSLTLSANVYAQSDGRYVGLIFNYTDASNYSLLRFNFHTTETTQWQFIERTTGTNTVVDSGSIKTGDMPLNTWRKVSIVSTSTAGQYTFSITNSDGTTSYASKTITSQSATPTLTGNAGLYFGNSYIWADNFTLTTNVAPVPEPATLSLLLGSAFFSAAFIWRKRNTTHR
ncbi:PEP-CTERM sorting domain-containing protein [Opitutaceae bacterium TAV4]|nr:PEP-CTERM sorting domain-containing protein [Opitutaceae bacterium TAV4]RRK02318.1 PEP-CTERM sorting domain-containing protein [Opitutaceae bacterium TAV3]